MTAEWMEALAPMVRQAGLAARRRIAAGRAVAARKSGGEWVTDIDRSTEEFLVERIGRIFPDHGVLGEEGGMRGEERRCWVIDPIDGTTNMVHGLPHCAVSVAYCERGRAKLALTYDVMSDLLYTAVAGGGAYCEGERLRVAKAPVFSESLFIASGQIGESAMWPLVVEFSRRTEGMRKTGSSVLDLTWLAAGYVDAVVSGAVNYWDVAAGELLVREAGGFVSDVHDRTEFVFGERVAPFVAAAPKVFARFFTECKRFCHANAGAAEAAGAVGAAEARGRD